MEGTFAVGYRSLFQTEMAPLANSWAELVDVLSQHRETRRKEAGPCWSPIIPKGDHRCNAAVAAVTALVLDVDDGSPLGTATASLSGDWIAYSTWSHSPEHPHYHIVVRLSKPVLVSDWLVEYRQLHGAMGHAADNLPAPAHAYFLPQHAPGAPWFVVHS